MEIKGDNDKQAKLCKQENNCLERGTGLSFKTDCSSQRRKSWVGEKKKTKLKKPITLSFLQFLGRLILITKENECANGISMPTFLSVIFKMPQAHNLLNSHIPLCND